MNENNILEDILKNIAGSGQITEQDIYNQITILIANIGTNKSMVSALVTSCLKKIITPEQDIRLHRTDFKNGYSARSLDTNVTTPFFKLHFLKYANKESAFLTLATREKIKWTLRDGKNLKIRNEEVKKSFLVLIDKVQNNDKAVICLQMLFFQLTNLVKSEDQIFAVATKQSQAINILNINKVIEMLTEHFSTRTSSRLPVIAIYTIYQELLKDIKRYKDKILRTLNVHTSADKHGYGDIEIWTKNNKPFEIIEIKHEIPIDRFMIFDIAKKSQYSEINRYYILTTYPNSFATEEEELFVNQFILEIKQKTNLEIIANGIITSLKYYLRFIEDYGKFLEQYTKNLIANAQNSTEVKDFHLTAWTNILKNHNL